MKRIILFFIIATTATIFNTGCVKDKCDLTKTFYKYEPIYITLDEMRANEIALEEARELKNIGQIYYYHHYLFINEPDKGIHVFDNADPGNPVNKGFIPIPGNKDMAIKDGILLADNYIDLVAINISDLSNVFIEKRVEDIFQNFYPLTENGFRIGWKKTEEKKEISCNDYHYDRSYYMKDGVAWAESSVSSSDLDNFIPSSDVGIGGSTARFTVAKEHLYTLGDRFLTVFDITTANNPVSVGDITVPWRTMETIFPYGDYIFVGANNGVYVFDNTTPENLHQVSQFVHVTSCDPVFVSDDIGFVTLNGNRRCGGVRNSLDVLDMADVLNPTQISTFPMTDPHGLSVSGNTLYLCDGIDGLEVYDIQDLNRITSHRVAHLTGFTAVDVIVLPGDLLLLRTESGIYQYNCSDRENLIELSNIVISK